MSDLAEVQSADLDLYSRGLACPIWRPFYTVSFETGQVEVRGLPTEYAFRVLWVQMCKVQENMPRILGNLLAHAKGQKWGGKDYITELMEHSGRKRSTLYTYHSTYSRLAPENQRPGIKTSYDREVARLAPELQAPMLDRIERGDFKNSDQVAEAVRHINKMPVPQVYNTKPQPLDCPFCGGNGLDREKLNWTECPHCHAHGDELVARFAALLDAVRVLYQTGERELLDRFVQPYKFLENQCPT